MSKIDKLETQPIRFSPRSNISSIVCSIQAVSAQELFSSVCCLTSDQYDLFAQYIKIGKYTNDLHGDIKFELDFIKEDMLHETTLEKLNIIQNDPSADYKRSGFIYGANPNIISLIQSNCRHDFKAIKIHTPGHLSIALWDIKKNTIEIFDPNGSSRNLTAGLQYNSMKYLFENAKIKLPLIKFVNSNSLQLDANDKWCQTYIYYYLYQRLLVNEPIYRIILALHKMTRAERFLLMSQFWSTITGLQKK